MEMVERPSHRERARTYDAIVDREIDGGSHLCAKANLCEEFAFDEKVRATKLQKQQKNG